MDEERSKILAIIKCYYSSLIFVSSPRQQPCCVS